MITTVTLNAAIDKTYFVPDFRLNKVNRTTMVHSEPGGKGVNVAKVLNLLDIPVITTGFAGGYNGMKIRDELKKIGIHPEFINIKEESRLCINIIDEVIQTQTEILESGPTITETEWVDLCEKIDCLSKKSSLVIMSGSLPKGLHDDSYKELISIVKRNHAKAVIDTSGIALEEALKSAPYMVKPNKQELAQLLKKEHITTNDILDALSLFQKQGIDLTVVSLGEEGALVGYKGEAFKVTPPQIELVNPVGCGDALVAGITAGLHLELDIRESLILGVSAATANALEVKAGNISVNLLNELKTRVKLEII